MTLSSFLFMLTSWMLVIALTIWSFDRIFRKRKAR